jgi:protein O-mannosyl-transferase
MSASQRQTLARARRTWPALLLAIFAVEIATLATHWPALSAQALCFDDLDYISDNALVPNPSIDSARRVVTEVLAPSGVNGYYNPLSVLSLMYDVSRGGNPEHVRPFRVTSLTLHLANTALVVILLYLLFKRVAPAAVAGLLFGLHPISVEPVVWLAERKAVLAAFFAFASLVSYVLYARRRGESEKGLAHQALQPRREHSRIATAIFYAAALLLYVLALLSKPTATPLPALMLVLDYYPLRRLRVRSFIEKLPFFAFALVSTIITITSQGRSGVLAAQGHSAAPFEIAYRVMLHLGHTLLPLGLSPFYPAPQPSGPSNPAVLAAMIALAILAAFASISRRWSRAPLAAALLFILALSPTLSPVRYGLMFTFDNYSYIPAIGLLLLVSAALAHVLGGEFPAVSGSIKPAVSPVVSPRRQLACIALVLLLAVGEAIATRQYLRHWSDSLAIGRYMVERTPRASTPHRFLADVFLKAGEVDDAIKHYRQAIALDPQDFEAHNNLGTLLSDLGQLTEAEHEYAESLRIRPGYSDALINSGIALARQNRFAEAAERFEAAIRSAPRNGQAYYNYGAALQVQGRWPEALAYYRTAVRLAPRHVKARIRLARMLDAENDSTAAVEQYEAALALEPDNPETHNNLACTLGRLHRIPEARAHLREALRLRPDFSQAQANLDAIASQP